MRAFLTMLFVAIGCDFAIAGEPYGPLDLRNMLLTEMPQRFYLGLGAGMAHHTGYIPNTVFNAEKWVGDGKVFGGYAVTDQIRIEGAYHYLGRAALPDGTLIGATEQSNALAGSAMLFSPTLSRWGVPSYLPARVYARFGGAYKWIEHKSTFGRFNESGVSYLIGGGIEIDLTQRIFFRFEYEYLSKIASGTARAVNVQHTPLTVSLGGRF